MNIRRIISSLASPIGVHIRTGYPSLLLCTPITATKDVWISYSITEDISLQQLQNI